MLKRRNGTFKGYIDAQGEKVVTFNGEVLDPRLDLFNHSRVGVDWGFVGSGALQLSFSILNTLFGEEEAKQLRTIFSKEVIAKLDREWELTTGQIKKWQKSVTLDSEDHDLYTPQTPVNVPTNVVKKVCNELDITQKRLAEILEVPEGTVSSWAVRNELPRLAKKAIEFYIAKQRNEKIVKQFKDLIALVS